MGPVWHARDAAAEGLAAPVPCCFACLCVVQIIDAVPKQPNTTFLVLVMKRWADFGLCWA
jgi:hypothetical protein